ncbi:hypothetical protein SRH_00960 [Mesomycoplasma hyorhinis MCLD]|uniref:Uncharacterized protein n=1 Tax=Mesomycoplasma hyorhinis (strain MCLD) TaxID=936139 RepID=A0ABM5M4T2_MESHM|nr:hypothetical protein SRH_00010 [Mesomycoplasma hyorhinis MCLD]AEC45759.1 hypothetical protein SRH_00960 [Mesomycoplasma hyorhinis MCLD]
MILHKSEILFFSQNSKKLLNLIKGLLFAFKTKMLENKAFWSFSSRLIFLS